MILPYSMRFQVFFSVVSPTVTGVHALVFTHALVSVSAAVSLSLAGVVA
jgi:hypothetical protein